MRLKISTICIFLFGFTGYSQLLEQPSLKFTTVYGKNDRNGKKTGLWTFYRKDKSLSSKSYWENGERNGVSKRYWVNGNLYTSTNYINGKEDGKEIYYYKDGSIAYVDTYKNGLKNGESKTYLNNGTVVEIENYKDDILHGNYIEYSDGEIDESGNYENGKKHGKWFSYNHGELKIECEYQNGIAHGLWKERFTYGGKQFLGKVEYEYQMVNGKLINPIKEFEYTDYYSENTSKNPDIKSYEVKKYYWIGNVILSSFDPEDPSAGVKKKGEWIMKDENDVLILKLKYNEKGDLLNETKFDKKGQIIEFYTY